MAQKRFGDTVPVEVLPPSQKFRFQIPFFLKASCCAAGSELGTFLGGNLCGSPWHPYEIRTSSQEGMARPRLAGFGPTLEPGPAAARTSS